MLAREFSQEQFEVKEYNSRAFSTFQAHKEQMRRKVRIWTLIKDSFKWEIPWQVLLWKKRGVGIKEGEGAEDRRLHYETSTDSSFKYLTSFTASPPPASKWADASLKKSNYPQAHAMFVVSQQFNSHESKVLCFCTAVFNHTLCLCSVLN